MPAFERYIGIDYSGAETPTSSLPGLRVYQGNAHITGPGSWPAAEPAQILDAPRNRRMAGF